MSNDALARLPYTTSPNTIGAWHSMSPYWKWVVMLYGPEMVDTFGGLQIVDLGLLPMSMVGLFKSGRVSWQD